MDDARLFLCARCRCQVLICSRCDRGQQYCGARCSGLARRESLRGAGRRYQHSRRGRHCHAERQRRYRRRCREGVCTHKVTHHGSAGAPRDAELAPHRVAMREANPPMSPKDQVPIRLAGSGACEHREQLVLHTLECALPEAGRAPLVERIELVGRIGLQIHLGGLKA